jgi:DNA-binding winged helix-turn-helix (wHTH) protein/Flp pilus assembly protein TadD
VNRESKLQTPGEIHLADEGELVVGRMIVRPATLEILIDGRHETIEPRMMQLLVALARTGGQVVSRDSLVLSCWSGRAIGDDAINRCVAKVRRLAGETAGFRIETIARVGYRLVAEAPPGEASRIGTSARATAERAARPALSRRMLIGGGAVAAAAVAGGWWLLRDRDAAGNADIPAAAREAFERGQRLYHSERFEEAIAAFQRAADAAPGYDDAWGWIALGMARERYMQPQQSGDRSDARIREATERALALDPRNAAALTGQAMGIPIFGDWLNAEAALRRVLQIDPQMSPARDLLAWVLENVGRWRESIDLIRPYAAQFDGLRHVQGRLAISLWSSGRLADADRVMDAARRRWPDSFWLSRFYLYARSGRAAQALAMFARGPRPEGPPEALELAELCARALLTRGPADIERAMAVHRRRAAAGYGFCENAIQLSADVGRLDEAFALCGAYYFGRGFRVAPTWFAQPNEAYTASYLRRTAFLFMPNLAPLRRDPRFASLLEELGLASYWRRSGTRSDVMA